MTVEELYGQMVDTFQRETGLALAGDGDMAVRLYAVAAQLYALYVQADWVGRQCFPQTAQGDYLDKHAQLRGLERRAATAAVGVLSFETDHPPEADLSIPEGTVCMTAAQVRFETTEAGVLKAGQTSAQVRARAVEPGAAGNAAAGTVRAMAVAPGGGGRGTNPEAFSGGLDAEGDESLRERVLETFRRMPNGANAAFYQQEALSFPEVAAATVVARPRGRVSCHGGGSARQRTAGTGGGPSGGTPRNRRGCSGEGAGGKDGGCVSSGGGPAGGGL